MISLYSIIRKPIITEKSSILLKIRKISFEIVKTATKNQIKEALKLIFDIKSKTIRTMIIRGKKKRMGKFHGKRKNIKKAIITVDKKTNINKFIIKNT
jgi:large subunit ribosomal protein L23